MNRRDVKVDVLISPMHGPVDPPPIAVTFKIGRRKLISVEIRPENLALALTGRAVQGIAVSGEILSAVQLPEASK